MRVINTQYNENNQVISNLWVNDKGEYFLEKNGVFKAVIESIKPQIIELTPEQVSNLQNLYKKEMLSAPVEPMNERLVRIDNPHKILGDEVINRIS